MNLSPKRITSGGYASRIIAAIDAEFAPASPPPIPSRYSPRSSPHSSPGPTPGGRQYYSTAAPGPQRATNRLHPFILPPRPVIVSPPQETSAGLLSEYEANRAMSIARKEREKAAFKAMPLYDCTDVSAESGRTAPSIIYSRKASEIDSLVASLKGPLGFDMEWKPNRIKGGRENRTATIQICDTEQIVIAQISELRSVPQGLKAVIENKDVVKCGVSILGDGQKLLRDYGVVARGLVDLGGMSEQADVSPSATKRVALAILVGRYLGRNLDKGTVRMSNWELSLSPAQIKYAANDAYCGLTLYNHFIALAKTNKVTLRPERYTVHVDRPPTFASLAESSSASSSSQTPPLETPPAPTMRTETAGENSPPSPSRWTRLILSSPKSSPASMRAYTLWRESNMPLDGLCGALRSPINPLKRTTVIRYLVEAIQADPSLPFERETLVAMINMEPWTRDRYRSWVESISAPAV